MSSNPSRPWWLRKRILFPLALFTGVLVVSLIAFIDSDTSTIVIYNETGRPLPPLIVRACDQTRTFATLADQESVRIELKPSGSESNVHLELATEPAWKWDGAHIKPHGGQRMTIRLLPSGQTEAFAEISWWQKTFN